MYEDLVKRLRTCGNSLSCNKCKWRPECAGISEAFRKAADAIEKLQEDSVPIDDMEMILSEVAKPRWIPVTETLPKTRDSILGKKSSKVIVAFRFDDGTQGTDTAHTLNGEWVFEDHITVVARTVTHWMPLPEPPKEG